MNTIAPLPRASRERWQPLRCGLVNLYKFDDQQFRFENGRLLLRGNNGTGKSRVLALTLPFLFDGQTSPHRIEPDQDSAKRMSWNLLMGRHDARVGYTWLEMGRRENGAEGITEHFTTVGCGMSAVKGKSGVTTWFFITDRRIGADLSLCPDRAPLSKPRLIELIGERGRVIDSAKDYREAVDATFFELGSHRYEAMLRLLIELRRPQLSRTLNEDDLSRALSEALPPIDAHVIRDVADAMSALEKDRQELDDYQSALAGVGVFLETYRRYAQIAARRAANPVRKTHTAYESAARALRQADKDAADAARHFEQAQRSLENHKTERSRLDARVQALAQSPEMRSASDLQSAEERLEEASKQLEDNLQQQGRAKDEADQRQTRSTETCDALNREREVMSTVMTQSQSCADAAALGDAHRRASERPDLTSPVSAAESQRTIQSMNQAAQKRGRSATLLHKHAEEVRRREQEADLAKRGRDDAQTNVQALIDQSRAAGQAIESRIEKVIGSYSAWRSGLQYLSPLETELVADQLHRWVADAEADVAKRSPILYVIDQALRVFQYEQARLTADAHAKKQAIASELDEVLDAVAALEDGKHTPPQRPYTRAADVRDSRPGAPLWRLVDFRAGVDEQSRGSVEAAMESAGLLDAWLMPDGRLLHGSEDAFLLAPPMTSNSNDAINEATLEHILTPVGDLHDEIAPSTVRNVLRAIGWGEDPQQEVWINHEGRWRNGPLGGQWHKPAVQHIGQAAREAERRRRLETLRQQAASISAALDKVDRRLAQLEQEGAAATQEAEDAPGDGAIHRAIADLFALQSRLSDARAKATEAEQAFIQMSQHLTNAKHKQDTDASDLGLTEWLPRLHELTQNINDYLIAVNNLGHQCDRLATAAEQANRSRHELASADQALSGCKTRTTQAQHTASKAKEKYAVLQQTIGVGAEQVREAYRLAKSALNDVVDAIEQAQNNKEDAIAKQSGAQTKRIQAEQEHAAKQTSRDRAIEALRGFAVQGFLRLAQPMIDAEVETDTGWSATRGVEVARQIDAAFQKLGMSDEAWQRAKGELDSGLEQLKETLGPKGYPPQNEPTAEDLIWITVPYQNQSRSVVDLNSLLNDEISHRQVLLDAREKEVIENHLIDEVAVLLHGLIQAGEQQVAQMNKQLEGRSTSTGMELRFKWAVAPDANEHLAAARRQLLRSPDAQTPEQREALAAFLQHQIRITQEQNDLLPWHESLAQALDYRRWHRFGVERRPELGTPWQALTKRTHGTGSGGEKAIALTIPQFAAAAAHYSSASPLAPRLIMLDEAFVGVDPDMRSKCLALLADFDLDLIMTSESEWGCYPGLDGNAIYQLATRQGIDAILCTRWVWNGKRKTQDSTTDRPHDIDLPPQESPASLYEDPDTS